jgi:hypothetical protein
MHTRPLLLTSAIVCATDVPRYGVSEWQVYLPEDVIPEHAEACNRILRGYHILNEQYAPSVFLLLASGVLR